MRALCWYGKEDVRVETVADPAILAPRDAILRVTAAGICGSDLHLYAGLVPGMRIGDILGHEIVGEIVETGKAAKGLERGARVLIPFAISCGRCAYCRGELWSLCDNSNPNAEMAERLYGQAGAGVLGFSHLFGGYAGGQAEYVRVPFADSNAFLVPDRVSDDQAVLVTDSFPAGYMAAEACGIAPGDTVAVWGCGPVGLFAIVSSVLLGAARVIAIDKTPERLILAERLGAEVLNEQEEDVLERLSDLTSGQGPDACIEAVGMEAPLSPFLSLYDRAMKSAGFGTDRGSALSEAIRACRKGGTVSVAGFYCGAGDGVPLGAAFTKGLTIKMGPAHVPRYARQLLARIEAGEVDPAVVVTHRMSLEEAPEGYALMRWKDEGCLKVVLRP